LLDFIELPDLLNEYFPIEVVKLRDSKRVHLRVPRRSRAPSAEVVLVLSAPRDPERSHPKRPSND
jgi:hypothetical protein